MTSYLIRRLLWMIVVVFGVSIIVFSLIQITPGDPARIMLGPAGRPEDVEKLRHQLGLDRSVTVQYLRWITRAAQGDLGESIVMRRPVLGEVLDRFGNTAILAGASIALSFIFGI